MNVLTCLVPAVTLAGVIGCAVDVEESSDIVGTPSTNASDNTKLSAIDDSNQEDNRRFSLLIGAIARKGENSGGDARTQANQVSNQLSDTEDLVMKLNVFFSLCDNNGRIYPHLEHGLQLKRELTLIGAHGTLRVLADLESRLNSVATPKQREVVLDEIESDYERIEKDAETNWQSLVLRYVERNKNDLSVSYK